jgi:hypothetical protein
MEKKRKTLLASEGRIVNEGVRCSYA